MEKKFIGIFCLVGILLISACSAVLLNGNSVDVDVIKDTTTNNVVNETQLNSTENKPIESNQMVATLINNKNFVLDEMSFEDNFYSDGSSVDLENIKNQPFVMTNVHEDSSVHTDTLYHTKLAYQNAHQEYNSANIQNSVDSNLDVDDSQFEPTKDVESEQEYYIISAGNIG